MIFPLISTENTFITITPKIPRVQETSVKPIFCSSFQNRNLNNTVNKLLKPTTKTSRVLNSQMVTTNSSQISLKKNSGGRGNEERIRFGQVGIKRILALNPFPFLSVPFFLSQSFLLFPPFFSVPNFTGMMSPPKKRLRGVVFDMDGTLIVPAIDFPAMHRAVLGDDNYKRLKEKNPTGIDILRHIESWSPEKQRQANKTITDFERQALDRLQLMPGAAELCGFLDSKKIRRGLITQNNKEAVDVFHDRFGIIFSPALSREFRPRKPDPAPILHICSTWGIKPSEVMMVGDSLRHDIACGKRAGAFTCLLDETGKYTATDFAKLNLQPDFKVSSLSELLSLLEANFDLNP
ncbi:Haloacid dehalogenase-like hydrolase domain-containing protein [Melia azedarach]|uniref:Haloacid dehalogenase-like hydrolase domain-containing protein n=1 Tax=Melia azedarach TaxID=155640 RepID=A0ACC1YGA7_MELAZ|nr:Haloacid dehalogenase-like hydrolase domain-containing protein [Melia azedarach]